MTHILNRSTVAGFWLVLLGLTLLVLSACGGSDANQAASAATAETTSQPNRVLPLATLAPTNMAINTAGTGVAQPIVATNTTPTAATVTVAAAATTRNLTTQSPVTTVTAKATPTPAKANTPASPITPLPWAGRGTLQDQDFFSPILNRNVTYRIYLPPGYTGNTKRYPVLYMLHGLSGSYKEWTDYGLLNNSDDMIAAGTIPPFIIVMPEGDQEYWMNHANGGLRWADYVVTDVVGHIDATYRTIADAANRAIGGHSMGGHGSLQIGLNHPETFSIIGSHSPTLRTKDQSFYYWGDDKYYATIDPVSLAKVKNLTSYKIFLDDGQDDTEWRPRVEELAGILKSRGVNLQFNILPGGHGGEYWIAHVKDYIKFYATAFPLNTTASSGG